MSRLLRGSPISRGTTRALECTRGTSYGPSSESAGQTEVAAIRHSPGGRLEIVQASVPDMSDGQVLVRNIYLSVDPAMRGWVSAVANSGNL